MPVSVRPRASSPKQTRRRSPESQEQFRKELLGAARALYREQGSDGLSVRALTQATGISPMTFYGYFSSKQDLIQNLWIDFFAELLVCLQTCARGMRSPLRIVEAHVTAYIAYWEAHPDEYRIVYMTDRHARIAAPPMVQQHPTYQQLLDLWSARIAACAGDRPLSSKARFLSWHLSLVKVIGYLHMAVALGRYADDERARLRREIVKDVVETIARTTAPEAA